jgi:hypothetical protein
MAANLQAFDAKLGSIFAASTGAFPRNIAQIPL